MSATRDSHSEADTIGIARDLAGRLPARAVVLLVGELGAGKTAFVRGLVEGAGGDPDQVSSPTFVLIQEYDGPRTVYHVDLYRLGAPEVDDLGPHLDELMARDGIVAIEWADRLTRPVEGAVRVRIDDRGGDDRAIGIDEEPGAPPSRRPRDRGTSR